MARMNVKTADGWAQIPGLETTRAAAVWHYTDAYGLHGVVTNNELWASTPLTLNDTTEMRYGIQQIGRAWKALQGSPVLAKAGGARQAFVSRTIDPNSGLLIASNIYFVCATREDDSLNQWQGYGGSQGYSIGLHTGKQLAPVGDQDSESRSLHVVPPGWYDVIYDEKEQVALADEALLFVLEHFSTEELEFHAKMALTSIAARFKHPAFADERETRYISGLPEGTKEKFRPSSRGITPYVPVKPAGEGRHFSAPPRGDLLPIVGVKCAPTDERDRGGLKEAVERLLRAGGHESAPVTFSEVPYRFS